MIRTNYDYETIRGIALYMIANGSTLRQLEKKFKISKSTIHSQFQKKLKDEDNETYVNVRTILDKNKAERAYRGGLATRQKFMNIASLKH